MDTGLPDKEIVVSLDILPELKELWLRRGINSTSVLKWTRKTESGTLAYQKTSNVWLVLPTTTCRTKTGQPLFTVSSCQELLYTYQRNNMLGFIHPSERYAEPRLGQVLDARVIGFREEGGSYLEPLPQTTFFRNVGKRCPDDFDLLGKQWRFHDLK